MRARTVRTSQSENWSCGLTSTTLEQPDTVDRVFARIFLDEPMPPPLEDDEPTWEDVPRMSLGTSFRDDPTWEPVPRSPRAAPSFTDDPTSEDVPRMFRAKPSAWDREVTCVRGTHQARRV